MLDKNFLQVFILKITGHIFVEQSFAVKKQRQNAWHLQKKKLPYITLILLASPSDIYVVCVSDSEYMWV